MALKEALLAAKSCELQLRARPNTKKIPQELLPLLLQPLPLKALSPAGARFTFCWVEDSIGLLVTDIAALGFAIVLEGTTLTEVVPTPVWRHRCHCKSPDNNDCVQE